MDYTLSVYLPEVAIQHSKDFKESQEKSYLQKKAGVIQDKSDQPVLMQMLQMLKN